MQAYAKHLDQKNKFMENEKITRNDHNKTVKKNKKKHNNGLQKHRNQMPMQVYINLCKGYKRTEALTMTLDGVLLGPFPGGGLVFRSVQLVDVSNLRDQRIVWIGVSQQGADRQKHLGNSECWRPLVLQDI